MKTMASTELPKVLVEAAPGGMASDVWLRKNITKKEGEDGEFWEADEVHMLLPGTPTADEVEARFDELWAMAEAAGKSLESRVDDVEVSIGDVMDALAELGSIVEGV